MGFETTEEIMAEELEKQRRKLREITQTLDQQYHMLKLIIQVKFWSSFEISTTNQFVFFLQKMEIKTEADDIDEGVSPNELRAPSASSSTGGNASRWSSPRIRKKLKHAKSFNKSA